jgi:CHAT domain-containing protein/tetratricopeptide (TPR) repeat protein
VPLRRRCSLPVSAAAAALALGPVLAAGAACGSERPAHRQTVARAATAATLPPASVAGPRASPAVPRASPAPRVFPLRRGPGAERDLARGEVDAWELDLAAGEYLHASFDQRGIDFAVDVFTPGHRQLFEVDGLYGPERAEEVHLVAETPGPYRIEVSCARCKGKGRYLARIEARRPAGPADRLRARAERVFWEARGWQGRSPGSWEAVAKLERSLLLYERLGATDRQAEAYYRLGKRYLLELNRFDDALEMFEIAMAHYRELRDRRFIALCYNQLGRCHAEMGRLDRALPVYLRAMAEWRLQPPWAGQAVTLENLGELYVFTGRSALALQSYRQAADLRRALEDSPANQANDFIHLGWVYRTAGDWKQALAALRQALELAGNDWPRERAAALVEMGNVFLDAGAPRRALPRLEEALKLEAHADPKTLASNLVGLGIGYRRTGEYAKALAAYRLALDQVQAAGDQRAEANTWIDLGSAYLGLGQPSQAAAGFAKALALARASGYRATEALARLGLAAAARDRRNLGAALAEGRAALEMTEALRAGAARSDLQAHYLALHEDAYGFLVGVLMQLHAMQPARGFDRRALQVSEQSRARGLLDDLVAGRESQARPRAAAAALLARRRTLLERIAAKDRERRSPLRSIDAPKTGGAELENELDRLLEEWRDVSDEIRGRQPGSTLGNGALPGSTPGWQRSLLDDGSALLEYYVDRGKSFLWVVTADSLASFELPGGDQLEPLVRAASRQLSRGELPAGQEGGDDPALRLSKILLGQVADRLGDRRLVIVPSGALHHVPFAALPDPGHAPDPLMLRHEIVYVPSLAVLAELRARRNGRPRRLEPIAVLADAVFGDHDERVKHLRVSPAGLDPMLAALPILPYSRDEAEAIRQIAGRQQVFAALDFDANPELVTSGRLRAYPILHFATHGTLRGEPELSALALSQLDRAGKPRDGWLRASQIGTLDLPAELVVLSACETALGEELAGEGLVGLPHSFLSAGARRVLVSLWQIGDRSTARLMRHFYRQLLVAKLPPAAALRAAQQAMWQDEASRAPSHWGAFVLEGDWR